MSERRVVVALVPGAVNAAGPGWTGVAVDVLRATSTLSRARANGAARIVPYAETAAALAHRDTEPGTLACGERDGRIVPGFDLGNSPFEYTPERVAGRTLAFASTNGSRAMLALAGCGRRLLGAFVTAHAVLAALADAPSITIACAGKLGEPSAEDTAFAGWLCARLAENGWTLANESATHAAATTPRTPAEIRDLVESCEHGRYLASLGQEFEADVRWCAGMDELDEAYEF